MNPAPVRWAVAGLGFSSAVTQLVLLRELLGTFQGNELILGLLLGAWLLLTGIGAWLGRWIATPARPTRPRGPQPSAPCRSDPHTPADSPVGASSAASLRWIAALQIWIALIPLAQVLAVRLGRNAVFLRGATLGLDQTVWSSLLVLAPYCLASGIFLTLASRASDETDAARGASTAYLADCLGSVIGGALFTFALVRWLDHIALLVVPSTANLLLAALTLRRMPGNRTAVLPLALAASLVACVAWLDPDARTTAWQCRPDRVVFRAQSPYGRLVVTESAGQLNFIENGLPLLSSRQIERAEEIAHIAMAQRPSARNVLLMSGALSGTAGEILKYDVTNVTCVELDPAVLEAGRRLLPERLTDRRMSVVNTDGRRYVQRGDGPYDLAIVDMPAPATAQLNRYYTAEFFAELRRVLEPDGVVVFGLGQYDNYVSPELARMLASMARTLRLTFRTVLLLPSAKVWFLASDGPLTPSIAARLRQAGVSAQWMRPSYLDAMLTPERLAAVASAADLPAPVNSDFRPVLYFLHLRHWLSQFDVWLGAAAIVLGLSLAACMARLSASAFAVSSGGFAGSALEVVLLLGVQVLYGSLYQQLGLVVTVFMGGLAVGAWLGGRLRSGDSGATCSPPTCSAPTNWRRGNSLSPVMTGDEPFPLQGPRTAGHRLASVAFALAAYGFLLPWILTALGQMNRAGMPPWFGQFLVALLTAGLAVLVGLEFPLACRVERADAGSLASRIFSADFVGACVGAILAGALLIPILGVAAACGLAASLNALAGLRLLWLERT
ncbi:MAG TPA: fused MFS/spermidine synthase [Candidatus Paceibacterota bacterium]|nr:fused MFS/spermidine synthase [Candidatus Paceibacterota bacterium]